MKINLMKFVLMFLMLPSYCCADQFITLHGTSENPFDVDNFPMPGIDAPSIRDILAIMKSLKTINEEVKFFYEGKKRSAKEIYGEYVKLQKNQKLATKQKVAELDSAYKETKAEFIKAFSPYLTIISSVPLAKRKYSGYVIESLNSPERNIKDSILRDWAKSDTGSEKRLFEEKIKNFEDLNLFMKHVNYFLGDLIKSCPKARAEYVATLKNLCPKN